MPRGLFPDIRRSWQRRQLWRTSSIIFSVALGACAGALVSTAPWYWVVGGTVVAALLLAFTAWRLSIIDRGAGTVYYVSAQYSGSSNWHEDALEKIRKGRRDLRVLVRTLHATQQAGVLDLTDETIEIAHALEVAENTDSTDSGFHLAPDLLWTMGMGLGSMMYGSWPNQTLNELPTDLRGTSERSRMNSSAHAAAPLSDHPAETGPEAKHPPAGRNTHIDDEHHLWWSLQAPEKTTAGRKKLARQWDSGARIRTVHEGPTRSPAMDCVFVTIQLTDNLNLSSGKPKLRPEQLHGIEWYALAPFTQGQPAWEARLLNVHLKQEPITPTSAATPGHGNQNSDLFIHPYPAMAKAVTTIRRAMSNSGGKFILLAMQVPKTVAIAIGWHLVHDRLLQDPGSPGTGPVDPDTGFLCRDHATRTPWKRLLLLSYDPSTNQYYLVRVHPDQPDLDVHHKTLHDLGLTG